MGEDAGGRPRRDDNKENKGEMKGKLNIQQRAWREGTRSAEVNQVQLDRDSGMAQLGQKQCEPNRTSPS